MAQAILFLILNALSGVAIAGQEVAVSLEAQSGKYMVRLLHQEQPPPGSVDFRWAFLVKDESTHTEAFIQVNNLTDELRELTIVGDLLVVSGIIQGFAEAVTIIDLLSKQQKDFFMGYNIELSPTKRYLIYNQFHPRMVPAAAGSSVILVYDLRRSPIENRLGPKAQDLSEAGVGHPIFPEKNLHEQSYRQWSEDERERHATGFPYFWFEEDTKVAFIDRHNGTDWLVLVDLSEGLEKAHIRKKVLDMAKIAEEVLVVDPTSKDPTAWLQTATKELRIKGLAQKTEGKIVIQIEPDYLHRYQYKTMEVEIPLP